MGIHYARMHKNAEAKQLMIPPVRKKVDNYHLIMSLVDCANKHTDLTSQCREPPQRQLSWLGK